MIGYGTPKKKYRLKKAVRAEGKISAAGKEKRKKVKREDRVLRKEGKDLFAERCLFLCSRKIMPGSRRKGKGFLIFTSILQKCGFLFYMARVSYEMKRTNYNSWCLNGKPKTLWNYYTKNCAIYHK